MLSLKLLVDLCRGAARLLSPRPWIFESAVCFMATAAAQASTIGPQKFIELGAHSVVIRLLRGGDEDDVQVSIQCLRL